MLKKILIGLLIVLIIIQFIHPAKNISTATAAQDINAMYPLPDSVHNILQKACYDCHSNTTRYPWYNNIQPVAWWMNDHINDAKRALNFSEFGSYTTAKQAKKINKVAEAVQQGWMPLSSYKWIHKDAVLTDAEKNTMIDWATSLSKKIAPNLPPDGK